VPDKSKFEKINKSKNQTRRYILCQDQEEDQEAEASAEAQEEVALAALAGAASEEDQEVECITLPTIITCPIIITDRYFLGRDLAADITEADALAA
jgi:hypothetical protein